MKDASNKYAQSALRERRAELAGELAKTEGHLRHLRDSLTHIDAALRLFNPEIDPESIKAKKPYKRVKLFGHGKLNRMVLDALRRGEKPMTTAEIVDSIVATLGYGPEAAKGLRNRVRGNLAYLRREDRVTKEGERASAKWRLKENCTTG